MVIVLLCLIAIPIILDIVFEYSRKAKRRKMRKGVKNRKPIGKDMVNK